MAIVTAVSEPQDRQPLPHDRLSPMLLIELSLTVVAKALAYASFHTDVPRADEMGPRRSERTLGCIASQRLRYLTGTSMVVLYWS
jgi:hypothetical protein